jgi:hypothetical protein
MKSIEIKKINIGSVFKFCFAIGLVVGLIACILFLLTGSSLKNIGIEIGAVSLGNQGPLQIGATLLGVIIGSLAYGLLMGLGGAIGAFLYNIFASVTGGIVVKIGDGE